MMLMLPVAVMLALVVMAVVVAFVLVPVVIAPVLVLIVPLVLSSAIFVPEIAELLVMLPPVVWMNKPAPLATAELAFTVAVPLVCK